MQLCEDSLSLKNSDLGILFKQQAKQNKMTLQGQHNSCEEAITQAQPILTDSCLKKKGGMPTGESPSLDA